MAKIFHLELKLSNLHKYYGGLTTLCKHNPDIGISKFTLDRHNFETPYENEICIIHKGGIVKTERSGSKVAISYQKGVYKADFIMQTIYFQPKGIKTQYCEAGMIHESDPEHIWYLEEPCKILISEVKIIPKENVTYEKKSRSYIVQESCL